MKIKMRAPRLILIGWLFGICAIAVFGTSHADEVRLQYGPVGRVDENGGMQDLRSGIHITFPKKMVDDNVKQVVVDPPEVICNGEESKMMWNWSGDSYLSGYFDGPPANDFVCIVRPRVMKTLAGEPAIMPNEWTFHSDGPMIEQNNSSYQYESLNSKALTIFGMTTAVASDSLKGLHCAIDGQTMHVDVLPEGQDFNIVMAKFAQDERFSHPEDKHFIIAQCGTLPWRENAKVEWMWKNAKSPVGNVNEKEQRVTFKVNTRLKVKFTCTKLLGIEGCDPRQPIEMQLSRFLSPDTSMDFEAIGSSGNKYASSNYTDSSWQNLTEPNAYLEGALIEGENLKIRATRRNSGGDQEPSIPVPQFSASTSIARLPPYLGMAQERGILPGNADAKAEWPLALRKLNSPVSVKEWRLADRNTPSNELIDLLDSTNLPGNADILSLQYTLPFPNSTSFFKKFAKTAPVSKEYQFKRFSNDLEFVGIPISSYGVWLLEAENDDYRMQYARQQKDMIKAEAVFGMQLDIDFDGSLFLDGEEISGLPELQRRLKRIHEDAGKQWPAIALRINRLTHRDTVKSIISGLRKIGAKFKIWSQAHPPQSPIKRDTYAIVQRTNLRIATEYRVNEQDQNLFATIHVSSVDTGEPISNAKVEILTGDRRLLNESTSDDEGNVKVNQVVSDAFRAEWIIVRHGDDVLVYPTGAEDRCQFYFDFGEQYSCEIPWDDRKIGKHPSFIPTSESEAGIGIRVPVSQKASFRNKRWEAPVLRMQKAIQIDSGPNLIVP